MDKIKTITLRPTYAEINLNAIENNLKKLSNFAKKSELIPILKANSYGHGLVPIAKFLQKKGYKTFGLAFLEEGISLRKNGIHVDILIMGGFNYDQVEHFINYNLIITASSIEKLDIIDYQAKIMGKKARVHLKIDTGMGRLGYQYYSSSKFFNAAIIKENIIIEGVFSHFANADTDDEKFTEDQFNNFLDSIQFFKNRSLKPKFHIANSAAIVKYPHTHFDMVRAGLMIYGYNPSTLLKDRKLIDLEPALSLKSEVIYFKVLDKGRSISYGSKWFTPKKSRIVTIPIGYGDGYPRLLTGKGEVLIRGKRYPVVGTICMDQIMVNIDWDEAFNGDEVVLIGKQGDQIISCDHIADKIGTISYEILTQINMRVPRIYIYDGERVKFSDF